MVETRGVQPLDAIGHQVVAVGEYAGDHAVFANAPDDVIEIRVQHRLAAAERDDAGSESGQMVDATKEFFDRYRRGVIVELVAVGAGKIAATHGNHVDQDRMVLVHEAVGDHSHLAHLAPKVQPPAAHRRVSPCDGRFCGLVHAGSGNSGQQALVKPEPYAYPVYS